SSDLEDDRGLRWIEVEPDDRRRLLLKGGIVRSDVTLHPMRLQSGPFPGARDRQVMDAEDLRERTGRPLRHSGGWRSSSPVEDPGLDLRGQNRGFGAFVSALQPIDSVLEKALLPGRDRGRTEPQCG